ncbi:AAA family ATPase [Bradyrhizobium sp. CER78]|nr:AAA family ATPase [Bradyrhizobium sp. CER78]MDH2384275.1 AAA family ATPase [Bradyrhizobium sp. CER78]
MLTKFISIKNIGRFRNSAGSPNPQLFKHTFISGANGFGKSTLCAVLRSLHTGQPDQLIGRKSLGTTEASKVDLLFDTGVIRFNEGRWSEAKPSFSIFDGVFVAENVHAGEVVDVAQKRNLYRIIVGSAGVGLAERDSELAADSRARTTEISASTRSLQPHLGTGMSLETFLNLEPQADIDAEIDRQEVEVAALTHIDTILERPELSTFDLHTIPSGIPETLRRTLDGIADDAERIIEKHFASHNMKNGGGNWVSTGLNFANDDCPFCGQEIARLPLVKAFRAVFSDAYAQLHNDVSALRERTASDFGEGFIAAQAAKADRNSSGGEFWKEYVSFEWDGLKLPPAFEDAVRNLRQELLDLLDRKARAPLEVVDIPPTCEAAVEAYRKVFENLAELNARVARANAAIVAKKQELGTADPEGAKRRLSHLEAVKARHTPTVSTLCDEHNRLVAEKTAIDEERGAIRAELNEHTRTVVAPYQNRINELLDLFNAGFRIAQTTHSYPSGIASTSYQLVIDGTPVDVGGSRTPETQPSFKNTLSAGDKMTLALSFFLAGLEQDADLANKIVVFDDPFTSQDVYRRRQTGHEIMRVARACKQLIVLSHDPTFLKQLWAKAPSSERICFMLSDHRALGTKLAEVDIERACQGRTLTDTDDLRSFVSNGSGNLLDIVRKMRVVLEAYCRTTFPSSFQDNDWLGDMVRKIREGGATHPAAALYDELDQINGYSAEYHHGEDNNDTTPDQIDDTELKGYVRRTLRVINALEA